MYGRLLLSFLACTAAPAAAQSLDSAQAHAVIGCYLATPAFTYSAFGEPERGDTAWAVLRLAAGGVAGRPLLRPWRDRFSKWLFSYDTLTLQLHDGLVGWHATLLNVNGQWRGKARYLTDALGAEPIDRDVALERRSCDGLPNPSRS